MVTGANGTSDYKPGLKWSRFPICTASASTKHTEQFLQACVSALKKKLLNFLWNTTNFLAGNVFTSLTKGWKITPYSGNTTTSLRSRLYRSYPTHLYGKWSSTGSCQSHCVIPITRDCSKAINSSTATAKFATVRGARPVNLPDLAWPELIAVYKQWKFPLCKCQYLCLNRNKPVHKGMKLTTNQSTSGKKKITIVVSAHKAGNPAGTQRDEAASVTAAARR